MEIDDVKYTKDNKLKELQSACQKLGLPTSGSKMRVLRRLQQYKYKHEERVAFEVAQRLYSEARREAVPVPTPKLPSRHEQEMHHSPTSPIKHGVRPALQPVQKKMPEPKQTGMKSKTVGGRSRWVRHCMLPSLRRRRWFASQ